MTARRPTAAADRDLAAAVLADGSERAFRELYRRHTPRLYQFVLRLLGGDELGAEDAVQETWLRACRGLDRFRWDSALSTWLHGIGLHVARDQLRRLRRGREETRETPDPPAPSRDPGVRIDLERAIARLPSGCRLVLVLHDVEGMKHEEIAAALGIAAGTSKSQLHEARKRLRADLAARREEGDRS